jgi:hypothetical protein
MPQFTSTPWRAAIVDVLMSDEFASRKSPV